MTFEFAIPFDGTQPEITEAEQELVSTKFTSFVQDTLLGKIGSVKTSKDGDWLELTTSEAGQPGLDIFVEDCPKDLDLKTGIHLREMNERGHGGDGLSYRLGGDGVVRRVDLPKHSPEIQRLHEGLKGPLSVNLNQAEALANAEKLQTAIIEGIPNFKLETVFGVNNQPIGLNELDALISLVETARLRK